MTRKPSPNRELMKAMARWLSPDGHVLDLMPADESIIGFSNRWYAAALARPVR